MIELTFLALLNRLTSWGRVPVMATRVLAADAAELLALVSDPAAQRRIIDIGLPLRLHAHVEPSRSKRLVSVRVTLGRRDLLWITWILVPSRGTTEVDVSAQVQSRALPVRLVMVLGGSRWLRDRLEETLTTLAVLAHCVAEDLDDIERNPHIAPRRRARVAPTAPCAPSIVISRRLDREASVGEPGA